MIAKTKILAVGNDPELLGLLQQELNDDTYEVVSTQDTGAGLRDELHEQLPDFIILDIMMPTLDGIEICLHLRQWTQVPIMMLSKWDTKDGMVRGLNLGSENYLTEPFGIEELKVRIKDTIKRNATTMINTLTDIRTRTS